MSVVSETSQESVADASEALCFDFGGTAVSIASDNHTFTCLVRERYKAFATSARPKWQVCYQVASNDTPAPEFICAARQHSPRSQRRGQRIHLETPTFEMVLDRHTGSVSLSGPLATYPIDRLIETLCYETIERSLILHAAALADGDRGFLMSGPSGCGKSTIAALFPDRALCDEFVAVTLDAPSPRLAALPFWKSRRGSATLRGIYLLEHGPANRRRKLTPGEALGRLRREVVWPTFDDEVLRRAFETLFELVSTVPVWELAFRPSVDVWQVIDRQGTP